MAQYFRANNVRAVLDLGFSKFLPLEEMKSLHDYSFATERAHCDVILGHWFHIDPGMGAAGVKELRRCIDGRVGFVGYAVSASKSPPASGLSYDPFYKLCIEARIPVLIFVGSTGLGAGLPGGDGVILDNCHPRHLESRKKERIGRRGGDGVGDHVLRNLAIHSHGLRMRVAVLAVHAGADQHGVRGDVDQRCDTS